MYEIAGYVLTTKQPSSQNPVKPMADYIADRAPDDRGFYNAICQWRYNIALALEGVPSSISTQETKQGVNHDGSVQIVLMETNTISRPFVDH